MGTPNSDHLIADDAALPENLPGTEAPTGESNIVRLILADSQAIYRVGMRKIFALEDDIRVVAQVDSLQNLDAAVQRFPTDIVILEGSLISGTTDAIPAIVRRNPQVKIIIQAVSTDESNTVELYRRGVRGIIPRSISPDLSGEVRAQDRAGRDLDRQSIGQLGDRGVSLAGHCADQPEDAAAPVTQGDGDHHLHHARET